jgi:hypothetical protein
MSEKLHSNKSGKLAQRVWLYTSETMRLDPGAPGYDPASATGILLTLRDIQKPGELSWSPHATGLHPLPIEGIRTSHSVESDGGVWNDEQQP